MRVLSTGAHRSANVVNAEGAGVPIAGFVGFRSGVVTGRACVVDGLDVILVDEKGAKRRKYIGASDGVTSEC